MLLFVLAVLVFGLNMLTPVESLKIKIEKYKIWYRCIIICLDSYGITRWYQKVESFVESQSRSIPDIFVETSKLTLSVENWMFKEKKCLFVENCLPAQIWRNQLSRLSATRAIFFLSKIVNIHNFFFPGGKFALKIFTVEYSQFWLPEVWTELGFWKDCFPQPHYKIQSYLKQTFDGVKYFNCAIPFNEFTKTGIRT